MCIRDRFEESHLTEMEISEGDAVIRLSRAAAVGYGGPAAAPGPAAEVEPAAERPASIDSPMVGTFYNAPAPDAEPFVEAGSAVKPGDVLCIIEAMKTFNQLECEVSGTIMRVLKSNGDPVEYGEPLFLLR